MSAIIHFLARKRFNAVEYCCFGLACSVGDIGSTPAFLLGLFIIVVGGVLALLVEAASDLISKREGR